jgi:hypothetical protein
VVTTEDYDYAFYFRGLPLSQQFSNGSFTSHPLHVSVVRLSLGGSTQITVIMYCYIMGTMYHVVPLHQSTANRHTGKLQQIMAELLLLQKWEYTCVRLAYVGVTF